MGVNSFPVAFPPWHLSSPSLHSCAALQALSVRHFVLIDGSALPPVPVSPHHLNEDIAKTPSLVDFDNIVLSLRAQVFVISFAIATKTENWKGAPPLMSWIWRGPAG